MVAVFPLADTELIMPNRRQILEVLSKKILVGLSQVSGFESWSAINNVTIAVTAYGR